MFDEKTVKNQYIHTEVGYKYEVFYFVVGVQFTKISLPAITAPANYRRDTKKFFHFCLTVT
jgi:hypothetical protein